MRFLTVTAASIALCTLLLPARSMAQESRMIEGARPEVHMGIGWHGELGFGARIDIPIVPSGFLSDVHDELALSPGGDLYFAGGKHDHLLAAAVLPLQWNLYVHPDWSLFPELGIALLFGDHKGDGDLRLHLLGALGARYHFGPRNALVMRLSWPFGLQVGLTF